MKISLMAAMSENNVIGNGPDIPWKVKGEQLLFKAVTFNQWLLVGRKTFESMGVLPNRKYAVISGTGFKSEDDNVLVFQSVGEALDYLSSVTDHVIVSGGGHLYQSMIDKADVIHLSVIHAEIEGDIIMPDVPDNYTKVFEQDFESNINYTYQIWRKC